MNELPVIPQIPYTVGPYGDFGWLTQTLLLIWLGMVIYLLLYSWPEVKK